MNSKSKKNNIPKWAWLLISFGAAMVVWYLLSINATTARAFQNQVVVLGSIKTMIDRGVFWKDISSSLISVTAGFALGFALSRPSAILMAWYAPVRNIVEPWIQFIRNIPPLAYVPLIVMVAGVGRKPQIIVITIATFLIMTVTIYQGVINVDETLIKAARVLGATDKDIFLKVIAPATLPFIITAIRLGSSTALTTLIAAESTGAQAGLGMRIRSLNNSFESAPMLMYVILIGILGMIIEKIVKYLEKRFTGEERSVKVKIDNVRRVFNTRNGEMIALNGVSLDIMENEFICVVGPSGCGKSTLLNIIAGLLEPTSGKVYCDGKEVTGTGTERGVVFQQYALFPWMTVKKNVMFGLNLKGIKGKEAEDIAMKYIKMVQLEDFVDHYPKELSGGMKQRVAIARAYAVNPSILLMDEPFGALDAQTRTQLQTELLETWEKERKTCFFITHDVDEAIILAQKVIIMSARPGRIKEIVDINIPYPRTQETKMTPEFLELKNHIWSQVYQEYLEVRK